MKVEKWFLKTHSAVIPTRPGFFGANNPARKLEWYSIWENNIPLNKINTNRFPSIKIIKIIPNKISLFETVLVSANDELVSLFLNKKINFNEIVIYLKKILSMKIFLKLKKRSPKNYNELINLRDIVRLKNRTLCNYKHTTNKK